MKKIKWKKDIIIKRVIPLTLVVMLLATTLIGIVASVSSLFSQNNLVGSYGSNDEDFIDFDEFLKQLEESSTQPGSSVDITSTQSTSSETTVLADTTSSQSKVEN